MEYRLANGQMAPTHKLPPRSEVTKLPTVGEDSSALSWVMRVLNAMLGINEVDPSPPMELPSLKGNGIDKSRMAKLNFQHLLRGS